MTTARLAGATALVTGGAGTIGSTIVDQLLAAGAAEVRVLDNLVRGRRANLREALGDPRLKLVIGRHSRHRPCPRHHQGLRRCLPPSRDPHHTMRRGAKARA